MWISILILLHVVIFLLLKKEKAEKRDLEKRVSGPFVPVAPSRFPECENEAGYYDPDKKERERIAQRNKDAVDEIDRVYKTVGVLRELKKM